MKLYDSIGPNPWLVRIFLAEKNLSIPLQQVDLVGGENRREPFLTKNPAGQLPCLELDSGAFISETLAICEYIDELQPLPPLIGTTAEERAQTRMWLRRVELHVTGPMTDGFRFSEGLGIFKNRIRTIPQAADDLKAIARDGLAWLDRELASKPYLVGERFTLADILLFPFVEFFKTRGQPLDPKLKNVSAWLERMGKRPSVAATAHA